jgi:hypothetical protein
MLAACEFAAQCGDDRSRVFASHLDQGRKTRMPLHQRRDVTVFCAANEIAFPMTGDGAILDLCYFRAVNRVS